MLVSLSIQQLAIVDHLDLDFHPGMTVITGETGAGKSILLQALGLALGDRADSDTVRHGAERGEVTAVFDLTGNQAARAWLDEHDLPADECILRRSLLANGRSKAWINGQPCPVQQLRELGQLLLDIHGQHEHQSLLKKETHLQLLDEYGKVDTQFARFQAVFRHHQQLQKQLDGLTRLDASQKAELQLLTYQVEELNQLDLQVDELAQLETEQRELANAEELIESTRQALNLCDHEEGGACQQLHQALQRLQGVQQPQLDSICQLLNEAQIQLQEASRELAHYADRLEVDPQRLQQVEQRLSQIYQLARKHQVPPEELPLLHQQLMEQLQQYENRDEYLALLQKDLAVVQQQLVQEAAALSQARKTAATELETAIEQQLAYLGMEKSRFRVQFSPLDTIQQQGSDDIEFLIAPHPGQPPKPLIRIASGGELSRISLAIQVVTAHTRQLPTLVFDEVDVGISGATAEIVGHLLHQLAARGQILCVTHLPQVAAQGDQHLHIHKVSDDHQTLSQMTLLSQDGRVQELARMMGGVHLSESTLAHAREMLKGSHH